MTENQLHEAKGEDLSLLLGEVLQPETVCCDPFQTTSSSGSGAMVFECAMCNTQLFQITAFDNRKCKNFKPIPLDDWNVAMKRWAWAVEKFGTRLLQLAMWDVQIAIGMKWNESDFVYYAQPEHYLTTVALCEYRSWPILWHDSCACDHRGCLSHVSHPCERCGRTAGRGVIRSKSND